jgi:hypothetical protein
VLIGRPNKTSIKNTRPSGADELVSRRQSFQSRRMGINMEESNIQENMDEIQIEMNLKESAVGKKLSELTTKRVIIIVLILIVVVPLCDSNSFTDVPLYSVYGFYLMEKLEIKDKDNTFSRTCQDFIDVEKGQRKPLIHFSFNYLNSSLNEQIKNHYCYHFQSQNPDDLRADEKDELFVYRNDGVIMRCVVNLRADITDNAILNISRTVFVCLLLTMGTMFFSKDAHELVLHPIERMIDRVKNKKRIKIIKIFKR